MDPRLRGDDKLSQKTLMGNGMATGRRDLKCQQALIFRLLPAVFLVAVLPLIKALVT